jgi:hypothetical protein
MDSPPSTPGTSNNTPPNAHNTAASRLSSVRHGTMAFQLYSANKLDDFMDTVTVHPELVREPLDREDHRLLHKSKYLD